MAHTSAAAATTTRRACGTRTSAAVTGSGRERSFRNGGARRRHEEGKPHRDPNEHRQRRQGPCELARDHHYQEPGALPGRRLFAPEEPAGKDEDREVLEVTVRRCQRAGN